MRLEEEVGLEVKDAFPNRGPFPMEDIVEITRSVVMLRRIQKAGRTSKLVQLNTSRKHRAAFSNYWHTIPQVMTTAVLSNETKKLTATSCSVYGIWYTKSMQAVHERMGEDVQSDLGISIELLLTSLSYLTNNLRSQQ